MLGALRFRTTSWGTLWLAVDKLDRPRRVVFHFDDLPDHGHLVAENFHGTKRIRKPVTLLDQPNHCNRRYMAVVQGLWTRNDCHLSRYHV